MNTKVEEFLYVTLAQLRGDSVDNMYSQLGSGEMDSLEGVELIAAAEKEYGIRITDVEISNVCRSVPAMAALTASKISAASTQGG